VHTIGN
jgi:class 3 adenylate cyclase